MAPLGSTIAQLSRNRRNLQKLAAISLQARGGGSDHGDESALAEVSVFGRNPGDLRMFAYVPDDLNPAAPLVVVLHGCTQNARGYDSGAGWSVLAERYGFALLMPQQGKGNNHGRCFNWYDPADTTRDRGELLSIRQMIATMVSDYDVDERRVFVAGHSAGGGMASALLANYPELFAGGAIVAGLPFRGATNLSEALDCMFHGTTKSAAEWGDYVREASPHRGPWPKISVWHGTADTTVSPVNAGEIVKQWSNVHGLQGEPSSSTVDGATRRAWADTAGGERIEEFTVPGMAHGTPLATGDQTSQAGIAGPYLLEVGISSGYHIARFWGLTEPGARPVGRRAARMATARAKRSAAKTSAAKTSVAKKPAAGDAPLEIGNLLAKAFRRAPETPAGPLDIGAVINRALKAAGLLRER